MGLIRDLIRARDIAREVIELAPVVIEYLEALREYRVRAGRDAAVGDLDDSLAKLRSLARR